MVVTGHTPNLLPGVSVMSKVAAADAVLWMDRMQYEAKGFCNRNRFPDGGWMVVPVASGDKFAPFNEVRVADPTFRARRKIAATITHRIGADAAAPYAVILERPWGKLAGLTFALLWQMCGDLEIETEWVAQSSLASCEYEDTSDGLAAMVAEVGGDVWLSGPSGRRYLDHAPFEARGIEVRYFDHEGPNPTALELLRQPAQRLAA